jgi:hypothetical protein
MSNRQLNDASHLSSLRTALSQVAVSKSVRKYEEEALQLIEEATPATRIANYANICTSHTQGYYDDTTIKTPFWHVIASLENSTELFPAAANGLTAAEKISAFGTQILQSTYNPDQVLDPFQYKNETVWHSLAKRGEPKALAAAFDGLTPEQKVSVLELTHSHGGTVWADIAKHQKPELEALVLEGISSLTRLKIRATADKDRIVQKTASDGSKVQIQFSPNGDRTLTRTQGEQEIVEDGVPKTLTVSSRITHHAKSGLVEGDDTVQRSWSNRTAPKPTSTERSPG